MNDHINIENKKRASIYLRCSTEEQSKPGHYGLQVQEDRLRQFCASQGYELLEENIYRDEGYSGTLEAEDRPGLNLAFEGAKNKQYDLLIVYRLDRLFRNQRKLLNALAKLVEYGVAFQSSTESFDTDTPSGRLMLQILGSFAEHERETIRDRMMGGKLRAARDGKWVTGVPPYGYRVDKKTKTLVIHEAEAEVVKKFYDWLVNEKCSLREITRKAIELNLPTPVHKPRKGSNRIGGIWYKKTINRILLNEVYTGQFYFNKYRRPYKYLDAVLDEKHQRPKDEHIPMSCPSIVSQDMYIKAVQQLKDNRTFQKRNEKRTYLFSGLLYSGASNKKLQSGYQKPKKDLIAPTLGKYYHIYVPALERIGRENDKSNPEGQCAETRLIPIWDTLVAILIDPKNVIPQLEEYTFKHTNEERTLHKITELDKTLTLLIEKRRRIAKAYFNMSMKDTEYEELMAENGREEKRATIEKQKLSQTLLKKKEQTNRDAVIKGLYKKLKTKLDDLSYEQQQYILRLFVERITLYHKQGYAEVVFKFPTHTAIPKNIPASVSEDNHMRLTLHVKIKSEKQRRREIIKTNPAMYKGATLVTQN